ncbi:MAG: putative toxin-antitoxin system toxin component, PIN family [Chloroflexota bacterium]
MRSGKARVGSVVDTNLIVSGLIRTGGTPYRLVRACRDGLFELIVSAPPLAEYERVLTRPKFSGRYGLTAEDVAAFLAFVRMSGVKVTPRRRLPLQVRDPKDEPILAAAIGGRADYLVTGDDDLLVLRDDPRLKRLQIVTAADFLAVVFPEQGGGDPAHSTSDPRGRA